MKLKRHRPKDGKTILCHLPEDYPWKLLSTLVEDLGQYAHPELISRMTPIIRGRDFRGYLALGDDYGTQCMPADSGNASVMRSNLMLTAFIKKLPLFLDGVDRKASALAVFRRAEEICGVFNTLGIHSLTRSNDPFANALVGYAQGFIREVIGSLPDYEQVTLWSRHGPGAAIGTSNGNVSKYFKFRDFPYTCTDRATGLAIDAISKDLRWLGAVEDAYRKEHGIHPTKIMRYRYFLQNIISSVPGNRITTVPKTAKVDRTIAIEPLMNLYLQLGVDGLFRTQLKKWCIDLDNQTTNRRMAKLGSISGKYATIDLSMASDTISTSLVKLLLPPLWYDYLISIRSPVGVIDGEEIRYNKISSMGNGYTFALETLIFASCCYAVHKINHQEFSFHKDYNVFGDDIIVPSKHYDQVVKALNLFGFIVNKEKSFSNGFFRESCGADWFNGRFVRPVYLKQPITNVFELITLRNLMQRYFCLHWGYPSIESKTMELLDKWIPTYYQYEGPCSDEDFSSYKHVFEPTKASFNMKVGTFKFKKLLKQPKKNECIRFNFRKLMHELRQSSSPSNAWDKASRGSIFDSNKRNAFTVTTKTSTADFWRSDYLLGN